MTTVIPINCRRCNVALVGPKNPKPDDVVSCPRCGNRGRYKDIIEQAKKQFVDHTRRHLRDIMKRSGWKVT